MAGVSIPLVVKVDDREGQAASQYAFHKSPVRVGRGELNDLQLDFPWVSSWHGILQFDEQEISFVDLGSKNGTFLNGSRLEKNAPTRVGPEDELTIGSLRIHLARREIGPRSPSPRPSTQFATRAGERAGAAAPPEPPPEPAAPPGPAEQALEAAAWQLGILHEALAEARRNFEEALRQALAPLPEAQRWRAARLAAERYPASAAGAAPGAAAPQGPGGSRASADPARLLRAFAESYLPAGAALDDLAVERMLGATAEVLEAAAKSFLELRRGYEEFGREMGIRVETGEGGLVRARDARSLLAWLLQPAEGESRARELASGFADLMIHQVALLNGVTEGARELVSRLSPEAVAAHLEQEPGRSRLALGVKPLREGAQWRAFVALYREVAEEEGALADALFGKAFARAYSVVAGRRTPETEGPERDGSPGVRPRGR